MKLYTLPGAPNPTKVMLYIAEKEALGASLGVEQIVVNVFKGEHRKSAHLARNPFGTMPVLELDDGAFIYESAAVWETLEELCPEPSMLGHTATERALARNLERVADARVLQPSATYVHAVNSPLGWEPDPALAERNKRAYRDAMGVLDGLLSDGRPFLAGERVTVADCTLQAALQFMRFRELEDLEGFANIDRWSTAYRQRPAAAAVLKF